LGQKEQKRGDNRGRGGGKKVLRWLPELNTQQTGVNWVDGKKQNWEGGKLGSLCETLHEHPIMCGVHPRQPKGKQRGKKKEKKGRRGVKREYSERNSLGIVGNGAKPSKKRKRMVLRRLGRALEKPERNIGGEIRKLGDPRDF